MDRKITIIGGLLGAVLAFSVTLLCTYTLFYSHFEYHYYSDNPQSKRIIACLLIGILGFIAGRIGAKSRNVNHALITGGVLFFLAITICMSPMSYALLFDPVARMDYTYFYLGICWIMISIVTGSLVCGLSSIVARDFHRFQRLRFFPRFFLSELLIFFTMIAVILSLITSASIIWPKVP
jgi:hypothetical protein